MKSLNHLASFELTNESNGTRGQSAIVDSLYQQAGSDSLEAVDQLFGDGDDWQILE